jgi:very-short-patch-repair endonuclease
VPVEVAVAEMAGRQHGVVGRWQLLALGLTRRMIEGRIRRGALHVVHRGVYAVGHRNLTVQGRWMAAVLAFGPAAVLSHRSAGHFWGLVPRAPIAPEVSRPRHAGGRPGLVIHQATLAADEVVRVGALPVTSVPRTMLDLAATLDERGVERAWNEMEVREHRDRLSVPDLLERHPGRKGAPILARLAARRSLPAGITRNDFEEAFLALVDRFGLPRPRMNVHMPIRERFFEFDALWVERRVIVELDGGAARDTRGAFEDDRERDRILLAERYTTTRLTWRQVTETPAAVAADLRLILTAYPSGDGSGALRPLPPR